MTHKSLVRAHVKSHFGLYYLVQLASGQWSAVWHLFVEAEDGPLQDAFKAIVESDEAWFKSQCGYSCSPAYETKRDALLCIRKYCLDDRDPADDHYFKPIVVRVERAIRKCDKSAASVRAM